MAHNTLDISEAQVELWEANMQLGYDTLPSLSGTIINAFRPGVETIKMPYWGLTKPKHKAKGGDVTYSQDAMSKITLTADKRPFSAHAIDEIERVTSMPGTFDDKARSVGGGLLDYEAKLIYATLGEMTPASAVISKDLRGVTDEDDMSMKISAALSQALGRLANGRTLTQGRWAVIPAEFYGAYMASSERFTNQNFAGLFTGAPSRPILGLLANFLQAGLIGMPRFEDDEDGEFTGLDKFVTLTQGGDTVVKIPVYEINAAGILVAKRPALWVGYDPSIGDNAMHGDSVAGVSEGLDTSVVHVEITLADDPFNIAP